MDGRLRGLDLRQVEVFRHKGRSLSPLAQTFARFLSENDPRSWWRGDHGDHG